MTLSCLKFFEKSTGKNERSTLFVTVGFTFGLNWSTNFKITQFTNNFLYIKGILDDILWERKKRSMSLFICAGNVVRNGHLSCIGFGIATPGPLVGKGK